jgi:hypothetical protein
LKLSLNSNRDLPSQFTNALNGRRIELQAGNADQMHPYTALAACWRKTSGPATELWGQLRQMQVMATTGKEFAPELALAALKNLIYSATETFDFYYRAIPAQLMQGRSRAESKLIRDYEGGIKRLRDPVGMMCNRMKHGSREIVAAKIVSESTGKATFVYRINAAYDGVQKADTAVHRDGGFLSIERTLHEIIHGLLRADYKAGELVLQLSETAAPPIELNGLLNLGLAGLLDELAGRPPIVADSESNRFNGVEVEGDEVRLIRVAADKVPEPTIRTMIVTADEVARSVQVI